MSEARCGIHRRYPASRYAHAGYAPRCKFQSPPPFAAAFRRLKNTTSKTTSIKIVTAITPYAHGLATKSSSISTRDRPKPTTHASKLMQMRRNVSESTWRMKKAPSGIPTSTLGMNTSSRFALSAMNRPSW